MGTSSRVDFYRLPRPVQDRFAAATRRTAPPAPLLFRPAPRGPVWALLGSSGALALLALLVLSVGWGSVGSRVALHGPVMVGLDVALFAGAAYGVLHAMARLRALEALPFRAGTYVFPGCVVEAMGPVLRVWPAAEAEAIERAPGGAAGLALRMRGGESVVVAAASVEEGERAERALAAARPALLKAVAEGDAHTLANLDPLHDSALSNPIGPTEPMAYAVPAWTRVDWGIALVIGAALGLVVAEARNALSDEAMFARVVAAGDAQSLEAYLAQRGRHAPEVRDVLLPRVELAAAEASGSVAAVRDFARAHPGSKIQVEIDAALRRRMLVELDKARKVGTVAALDAFAQSYPDSGVGPELRAARHALYAQALETYRAKASEDPAASAFVERLLAFAEKSGKAACEVRFRQQPSQTFDDAEQAMKKNPRYPGPDALPSHYFTTDALRAREQRVAQELVARFSAAFPADVLALRAGAPLDPGAALPSDVPTLVVTYAPEWSHANTISTRPPTLFAGVNISFEATFVLPEGAPLTVRTKAWRGAELWKMKADGMTREDFEQKVYDAMIDGAFDQLSKKLDDTFF